MNNNWEANLLPIAEDYFRNIFSEIAGMKALILDQETVGIISLVYSQSRLFKHDIYLVQRVGDKGERMPHLKAVYFVRPTLANLQNLEQELSDPRYLEYHVFFTNQIPPNFIQTLARVDTSDRLKSLQEVYLDYYATGRNIFTLNIPSTARLAFPRSQWTEEQITLIDRVSHGLSSLLLSLRVAPQVRYLRTSEACTLVADRVARKMELELAVKRGDYRDDRAILIITQRREDLITPLLIPWNYQAMLHEFIGLVNNKVDLNERQNAVLGVNQIVPIKSGQQDKKRFVVSEVGDQFFARNANNSFGQLAANIKKFIEEVGEKRNKAVKIESLEAMHDALDKIPELTQISASLSKHVTLSCDISDEIEKRKLMEVSRVQQDLACQQMRSDNIKSVWDIVRSAQAQPYQKLKLVILLAIKYPDDKEIPQLLRYLQDQGLVSESNLELPQLAQLYQRGHVSDLFHNRNIAKKAKAFFKTMLKDVPNVYTQHRPYLTEALLPQLLQGKLSFSDYPVAFQGLSGGMGKPTVIVFQMGGTTFSESCEAQKFGQAKVIVGGTFIHNSRSMLAEFLQFAGATS